ncbi:nucleotidyltransferase family protein [Amycolatopsis acidicola]|nr:nucleotidyltransferase family protein [Amycolatopsis acidicola]
MVAKPGVHFSELMIGPRDSIRTALSAIERHRVSTVFVVDHDDRLTGVVAERDIHRALLNGDDLDTSVERLVRKSVVTVKPTDGRAEVLDLMHALRLREVPIADASRRVCGVHIEAEIVGSPKLDNWAVIMAGGKGTRLGALTKNMPKPMLPVAGRPILERLVLHLVGSGIQQIFISVNYLADIIEKHFGDGSQFGCNIEYLREDPDRPLGTGGPLRLLDDLGYRSSSPILVMNGDLITAFSVPGLLESHTQQGSVVTVAVSEYQHQVPFGVLESVENKLVRIVEKPTRSWPVNAGIYVIEPDLLARIPMHELYPITELFEDCLGRGERIGLWSMSEEWRDIGRPAELAQARGQT